jgi:hypothetical protein
MFLLSTRLFINYLCRTLLAFDNNLFVENMNQYRLGASNSSNNSTVISKPQKLTLLQKLYKSFLKAWNFIALRGRQVLWIGSTGILCLII